jgi:hypothetical protein
VQARSVIPGRQRWDIGIVLASPRVAEFLEDMLQKAPGVVTVHANPITGRLLVHHDTALTSQNIKQLVPKAVLLSIQQAAEFRKSSSPTRAQKRQHRRVAWSSSFASLVVGMIVTPIRGNSFHQTSLSSLKPVPAAILAVSFRMREESLPLERAILSSALLRLSSSPSLRLLILRSPLPLAALSSFVSSPVLFILLSSPPFAVILAPFRSFLSSLSSFSSNPLFFVGSMLVERQQNRGLFPTPQ